MEDIVRGEERRRVILSDIDATRNYAIKFNADKRFVEELADIQQCIEDANVLETYFADFGTKEYLEVKAIFHEIHADIQQNFRKRDIKNKHRFQVSAIPLGLGIFFTFFLNVHLVKLVPADFIHEAVCASLGFLITTLYYIFYTLTIYFIGDRVSSKKEWSYNKQVIIMLLVGTMIFLPCYLIIRFYSINIYLFLSPYLFLLVQGTTKMDIGSLLATTSLVLGDLVALIATWDFIQKKLRKQKNDN